MASTLRDHACPREAQSDSCGQGHRGSRGAWTRGFRSCDEDAGRGNACHRSGRRRDLALGQADRRGAVGPGHGAPVRHGAGHVRRALRGLARPHPRGRPRGRPLTPRLRHVPMRRLSRPLPGRASRPQRAVDRGQRQAARRRRRGGRRGRRRLPGHHRPACCRTRTRTLGGSGTRGPRAARLRCPGQQPARHVAGHRGHPRRTHPAGRPEARRLVRHRAARERGLADDRDRQHRRPPRGARPADARPVRVRDRDRRRHGRRVARRARRRVTAARGREQPRALRGTPPPRTDVGPRGAAARSRRPHRNPPAVVRGVGPAPCPARHRHRRRPRPPRRDRHRQRSVVRRTQQGGGDAPAGAVASRPATDRRAGVRRPLRHGGRHRHRR